MATQTIRVAAPLPSGSYTVNVQTDGSNTNAFTGRTLTAESVSGFWTFTVTSASAGLYAFQVLSGSTVVAYGWFYSGTDAAVTIQDSDSRDDALQTQRIGTPAGASIAADIAAIGSSSSITSFEQSALDQLRGVEFVGPQSVYGEAKQIVAGDDYSGSRAIVFASDAIPDLSSASSITFSVRATDRAHTLAFSTTSVAYTTGQLAVTLTAAQTRIDPGYYDYDIEAVVGGLKQTVIGPKARLVVLEDQTR